MPLRECNHGPDPLPDRDPPRGVRKTIVITNQPAIAPAFRSIPGRFLATPPTQRTRRRCPTEIGKPFPCTCWAPSLVFAAKPTANILVSFL